ncbi:MAG: hypothetical protein EXR57_01525 [Dehalococcoidia bacterium]|nr:hypothetical protein [Dehalococcoidia bacterium]MSQ34485.1 hypothetical protein [Dehalococcoidia bacterium]
MPAKLHVFPPVRRFVQSLVEAPAPPGFRNPYSSACAAHNLTVFMSNRDRLDRTLLLLGEAPGYRGAAITGVPFASLSVLLDDWQDPWGIFGSASGFESPEGAAYRREATATIFWRVLSGCLGDAPPPLTWNAVPFHPHGAAAYTNRRLLVREVTLGSAWLDALLGLFPNVEPVAVGRSADEALSALGIRHVRVRHPSHGGAREFEAGLKMLDWAGGV